MANSYSSKLPKLTVYENPGVESVSLSFSVFSFFQHFDWKVIDKVSDIVELHMGKSDWTVIVTAASGLGQSPFELLGGKAPRLLNGLQWH